MSRLRFGRLLIGVGVASAPDRRWGIPYRDGPIERSVSLFGVNRFILRPGTNMRWAGNIVILRWEVVVSWRRP